MVFKMSNRQVSDHLTVTAELVINFFCLLVGNTYRLLSTCIAPRGNLQKYNLVSCLEAYN